MTDPRITDEAIESAAVAACETAYPPKSHKPWDDVEDWEQDAWRATVRAALEAALPHLAPPPVSDEVVEKAARAMYADVEVGEWELGALETLLAYRRAARVVLQAAPQLVVDRDALIKTLHEKGAYCGDCDYEDGMHCSACVFVLGGYADAVLALINGTEPS